jgi:dihydrodipicolinate synthase/N-acetylneuraminate lyase
MPKKRQSSTPGGIVLKTSAVTAADLSRSVIAVPPFARQGDLSPNPEANRTLIKHLEAGGVSTLMYGGNANFYNVGLYEYASILDSLEQMVAADTWVVPAAGPDFGKLLDQARVLRTRAFPTAMVLPQMFPSTPQGCERAIRLFAESFGRKVIVYIKADNCLAPANVARLVDSGLVAGIKYSIVQPVPEEDTFLTELVQVVDRSMIVSGIGERPAITHVRDFGLCGFTSGSVCVAPRGATRLLAALKEGRWKDAEALRAAYIPLEDARDTHSPIRVLHDAITLCGIADMGPMLPQLSNLDVGQAAHVKPVAQTLLAHDRALP